MKAFSLAPSISASRTSIVLLGFLLVLSLILTWTPELDQLADNYLNESIADAGVIYASARAINALISVIQSIEISVSLGAGVAVNLGEALDPLNDLIERFSSVVLTGLVGLGIQKLVLVASSSLFTKTLVTLVLVGSWLTWLFRGLLPTILKKVLILMILVRFAFSVEVGISWVLDKAYFEIQQQEAVSTLDIAKNKLQSVQDEYMTTVEEQGVFRGSWAAAKTLIGNNGQEGIADQAASAVVQLVVIVLVRSILLPLAFLWLLQLLFRRYISQL